jgi:hypothetical protein
MKRIELINRLIQEGISANTLVNFTDKQIFGLAERVLGEAVTSKVDNTTYSASEVNAAKQKGQGFGVKDGTVTLNNDGGITVATKEGVSENLKGNQKKIDKNHNGKIDSQDFKILRGQKKKDANEMLRFYDDDGNPIKDKKGNQSAVSSRAKNFIEKTKSKNIDSKDKKGVTKNSTKICDSCGKPETKCNCDHTHLDEKLVGKQKNIDKNHNGKIDAQDFKILRGQNNESKPSAGLSKEKKSEVVKKAKKGGDVGKKGKGFEMIANKAAKKYGSKEAGKKVAAAAMWKNVKREGVETKNWVKNLVENQYFHNFTSKNEIMELISKKLTENTNPGMAKKSNLPDFLTSKAIRASANTKQQSNEAGPATAPTKPVTKPDTKPGKPAGPYKPRIEPKQNPQAESAPATAPTKPKPTTKPGTKPGKPAGPYKPRIEPKQNPQAEARKIK